ncbi:unnamed protein product [Nezara viridula]|uniref:Uncharacterized protein n=1 Tax=Nezara viridula TaxID=85310 RepID=A0A9P0MYH2_NEZVI|nr:unnamed protein product [Nezara viridula]
MTKIYSSSVHCKPEIEGEDELRYRRQGSLGLSVVAIDLFLPENFQKCVNEQICPGEPAFVCALHKRWNALMTFQTPCKVNAWIKCGEGVAVSPFLIKPVSPLLIDPAGTELERVRNDLPTVPPFHIEPAVSIILSRWNSSVPFHIYVGAGYGQCKVPFTCPVVYRPVCGYKIINPWGTFYYEYREFTNRCMFDHCSDEIENCEIRLYFVNNLGLRDLKNDLDSEKTVLLTPSFESSPEGPCATSYIACTVIALAV